MATTRFKIGALAARTGSNAHVLRAWERRYGLLEPARTSRGQRLYSDDDVAVVLRARELMREGRRIGEVATAGRDNLIREGRELMAQQSVSPPASIGDVLEMKPDLAAAVLDALPCAVVLSDPEGKTRWINGAFTELCGYTLGELYGRAPGVLLQGPGTDVEAARRIGEAVRRKEPCSEELLNYHKDERPYIAAIDIVPLGVRGHVLGFVAVAREVPPKPALADARAPTFPSSPEGLL